MIITDQELAQVVGGKPLWQARLKRVAIEALFITIDMVFIVGLIVLGCIFVYIIVTIITEKRLEGTNQNHMEMRLIGF